MDYFQGVVTEYLRADRACFVNPEFWIRGNLEHKHAKPHWFVDVVAVNMRERAVYLCEVTYAKQPYALVQRLRNWKEHWERINSTLREDAFIDKDWPLIPWIFAPSSTLAIIKPELEKHFRDGRTTNLEKVLPWLYCTYDRIPEADDEAKEERPAPIVTRRELGLDIGRQEP
jgi:hypothetical protein